MQLITMCPTSESAASQKDGGGDEIQNADGSSIAPVVIDLTLDDPICTEPAAAALELNLSNPKNAGDSRSNRTRKASKKQTKARQQQVFPCNYCKSEFITGKPLGGHQNAHKELPALDHMINHGIDVAGAYGHFPYHPYHRSFDRSSLINGVQNSLSRIRPVTNPWTFLGLWPRQVTTNAQPCIFRPRNIVSSLPPLASIIGNGLYRSFSAIPSSEIAAVNMPPPLSIEHLRKNIVSDGRLLLPPPPPPPPPPPSFKGNGLNRSLSSVPASSEIAVINMPSEPPKRNQTDVSSLGLDLSLKL